MDKPTASPTLLGRARGRAAPPPETAQLAATPRSGPWPLLAPKQPPEPSSDDQEHPAWPEQEAVTWLARHFDERLEALERELASQLERLSRQQAGMLDQLGLRAQVPAAADEVCEGRRPSTQVQVLDGETLCTASPSSERQSRSPSPGPRSPSIGSRRVSMVSLQTQGSFRWPGQEDQQSLQDSALPRGSEAPSVQRVCSLLACKFNQQSIRSREAIWTFLEDHRSSRAARYYGNAKALLIMVSVVTPLLMSFRPPPCSRRTSDILENSLDTFFLADALARWLASPYFWAFLWSRYNVLDLVAACTLGLRTSLLVRGVPYSDIHSAFFYCLVPLARALKVLRFQPHLRLLLRTILKSAAALAVPLFLLFMMTMAFSAAIFLVEPREQIDGMPTAMYLVIVTMTTVGYGDIVPVTSLGKCTMSVLSIMGVLCMAMPIAIIGDAFKETWHNRDFLLLVDRIKERLVQWHFTQADAESIFRRYDSEGVGHLTLHEFFVMLMDMRLGMDEEEIVQVFHFQVCAVDGNQVISIGEFLTLLFPRYKADNLRRTLQRERRLSGLRETVRQQVQESSRRPSLISTLSHGN